MARIGVTVLAVVVSILPRSARAEIVTGSELDELDDSPYMFLSFGASLRQLSPGRASGPSVRSRAVEETTGEDGGLALGDPSKPSLTFTERFGVMFSQVAYLALEAEIGPAPTRDVEPGARRLALGGVGLFGLQTGTRLISVGAELAGGGRFVQTGLREVLSGEAVVEARARGELWLSPLLTVGAMVGTSLIARDEWVTGVFLGVHARAFDGS